MAVPTTCITFAESNVPVLIHLSSDSPRTYECRNPPAKKSPAAVVSTASTLCAGTMHVSSPLLAQAPLAPSFTTATLAMPAISSRASFGCLPPVKAAHSSSLAKTMSTYCPTRWRKKARSALTTL